VVLFLEQAVNQRLKELQQRQLLQQHQP